MPEFVVPILQLSWKIKLALLLLNHVRIGGKFIVLFDQPYRSIQVTGDGIHQ